MRPLACEALRALLLFTFLTGTVFGTSTLFRKPNSYKGNASFSEQRKQWVDSAQLGQAGDTCHPKLGTGCAVGFTCRCLALNRGLYTCQADNTPKLPVEFHRWERQGLTCSPHLPDGATPIHAPPLVDTYGDVVDPRKSPNGKLKTWALEQADKFYSHYVLVPFPETARGNSSVGMAMLGGSDVRSSAIKDQATILQSVLEEIARPGILQALQKAGVKFVVAKGGVEPEEAWAGHPEVHRKFITGLGGGAPWFPTTGIQLGEPPEILAEELFHTIQYVAMEPREVCMYHKAYDNAVTSGLYTTDNSGVEVDGEPVPTLQADEYLAMALNRWFGSGENQNEYKVPGNGEAGTGRQHLHDRDPQAFCLLSLVWRSESSWTPDDAEYSNKGMNRAKVDKFCHALLSRLSIGCPKTGTIWPRASSNKDV